MKKAKTVKKVCTKVAERDIRFDCMSLIDLLEWAMHSVPKGTKMQDIQLDFETDSSTGYYDDIIIDAKMILSYWEEKKE